MKKIDRFFYVIASSGSVNGGGYGQIVLRFLSEDEIINIANEQADRHGGDLIDHTDIVWVGVNEDADGDFEDYVRSREWQDGEEFAAALIELRDDGYLFEVFECEKQDDDFVTCASAFGLGEEAKFFIK